MKVLVTVSLWLSLLAPASVPAQFDGVADLTLTTAWCTHAGAVLYTGDFNGDGATDLLCRDPRRFWIDYADGTGRLSGTTDWFVDSVWCTHANSKLWLGDLNGDGRTDLLCKDPSAAWYDFADAEGHFGTPDGVNNFRFCTETDATLYVADLNKDRRADLLCRQGKTLRIDYGAAGSARAPSPSSAVFDLHQGWDDVSAAMAAAYCIAVHPYKPLPAGVDATPEYPAGFTANHYEVVSHPGIVGAVRRNYVHHRGTAAADEGQGQTCKQACAEFGRRYEPEKRGVPLHRKVIGAAGLVTITDGLGDLGDSTAMALVDQDFARGGQALAGARAIMVGDPWHEADVAWADYCCCGVR